MNKKLKAPAVQHYIDWLGRLGYRQFDFSFSYDKRSYELLDQLFDIIREIEPTSDNGVRELWLKAERGSIEDYGDFEEMVSWGDVKTREEFEELWKAEFPNEEEWYNFQIAEDPANGYRCIFLAHKLVIEIDPSMERGGMEYNISEFVEWILEAVKEVIIQLEKGMYNRKVMEELPAWHRTGTILRKDYWDVYPDGRKAFFTPISKDDVDEFVKCMAAQRDMHSDVDKRIERVTANDFYRFCAMGYKENGYDGTDLSPKEQYYKHADGRDDGLSEIDGDSPEAFIQWYSASHNRGGHPWEVCRGGNSTHISLYLHKDEEGWYLSIDGDAWNRTIESVKFYLALYREGLPVYMHKGKLLADRLLEKEKIGVVPRGVFPAYCASFFPDEEIIDYMNLPYYDEGGAEVAKHCIWQELPEVRLCI